MSSTLRSASIHEAGHAVVAHCLLCDVIDARVDPQGKGLTRVWQHKFSERSDICIALAGDLAAQMFDAAEPGGDKLDQERVLRRAREARVDDRELAELRDFTRQMLNDNRAAVRRVAVGLKVRQFLDGDEIRKRIMRFEKRLNVASSTKTNNRWKLGLPSYSVTRTPFLTVSGCDPRR
jgi:hypothetical protein